MTDILLCRSASLIKRTSETPPGIALDMRHSHVFLSFTWRVFSHFWSKIVADTTSGWWTGADGPSRFLPLRYQIWQVCLLHGRESSQTRSLHLLGSIKFTWAAGGQREVSLSQKTVRKQSCLLTLVFVYQLIHTQFFLPTASEYPFLSWSYMPCSANTLTYTYAYIFHITRFKISHIAMGNLEN